MRRFPNPALGIPFVLALLLTACNGGPAMANGDPPADEPGERETAVPEDSHDFEVVDVVTGLEHPWSVAFLPGGDVLVTERPGRIRLVRDGELRDEPVAGAPEVRAQGQGGMLDIVLHPGFDGNQYVYISYSKPVQGGSTTAVARARWTGEALEGIEDVFVAEAVGNGRHYGSRIAFDPDGYMYITVGDRGEPQRAQNLGDHAGTTIRLHDDGSVPADNPFLDRDDALDEIYTFGNRNAQGMAVHPETGEVWQNEHGPRGGDEVNVMRAGANYGWPEYRYADHYDGRPIPDYPDDADVDAPLVDWTPAIAPSGMAFYTGDRFPNWRGSTFHGGLAGRQLRRVVFDGTEAVHQETLLEELGERIRDVREGPDGYLYLLTDAGNARMIRLEPTD